MPESSFTVRLNPNIARLVCSSSGDEVPNHGWSRPIGLCPCCPAPGKPVVVEYNLDKVASGLGGSLPAADRARGMWCFEALLPVLEPAAAFGADVGLTPTVRHKTLARELEIEIHLKNEGGNPSGSFKDRGLAMGIAIGRALGAQRFCLPTQGNAGVAASLFSTRLGLPGALVYMPRGYEDGIYHREAAFFGAEVRFAGTNIAESGKIMRADCEAELASGEFVDMSTFFEPGRLEGKKTMGFEIFQHFGPENLPEWILYPTGGGTGLVGIWKAFSELQGLGMLDPRTHRLPKMVAVQSKSCAPVIQAFQRGLDHVEPVQSQGTVAEGLDVPGAIMGHGILSAIRQSDGTAVAVEENEIREAFSELGHNGVAAGYESAATLAALRSLRRDGTIARGASALLLLTANHLIPLGQR